jgi:hypothetical protein
MVNLQHVNSLPKFERNRCALACFYRLSAECCLKIGGIFDPILSDFEKSEETALEKCLLFT